MKSRKHLWLVVAVCVALFAPSILSAQSTPPADPYKPVLDRLHAITAIPLDDWQIHDADLAHGVTRIDFVN